MAHKAEFGEHVTYHRLESTVDGKNPVSSFPAIILGHDPGGDDIANVAFLNPNKKHLLIGADWRDAFDGAHSVPLGQGSGRDWYELLPDQSKTIADMSAGIKILQGQLAEATKKKKD